MNNFITAMEQYDNIAFTDNGAITNKSTTSGLLDYFANFAQYRNSTENDILTLFLKAFNEDRTNALRLLFYSRTPRNGQGEKRVFQTILKYLAIYYPDWVTENLDNIVKFGYYKDLYCLSETFMWNNVVEFWCNKIKYGDFLAAKYAPTETQTKKNKDSKNKYVAYFVYGLFGNDVKINYKNYRLLISSMRANANIVERLMSTNQWSEINYEQVPSLAHKNYNKAFAKRDAERYALYLSEVKAGNKKINASILNPVELVAKYCKESYEINDTLELLWKALPNYFIDSNRTIIPVLDCSGSMSSGLKIAPIYAAMGLGIYCMQHNTSEAYKNKYITFSNSAKFYTLESQTLFHQLNEIRKHSEVANTNLQKVFDLILGVAIKNKLTQDQLPTDIMIISDMQFDTACKDNSMTNYQVVQNKFNSHGYELPIIWFWNVDGEPTDMPVLAHTPNTFLLSGYSPSIIKTILTNKVTTPYDLMMAICNREDLQCIKW
jgi:hypothetical protein